MSASTARRLAWVVLAMTVLLGGLGCVLLALTWHTPTPANFGFRGYQIGMAVMFGGVGALIATRRPGNAIGWLCGLIGLLCVLDLASQHYAVYAVRTAPGALPGGPSVAWMHNWLWTWLAVLAGPVLFLLFPAGSLPSRRWRVAIVLGICAALSFSLSLALTPGPLEATPAIANPYGVEGIDAWLEVGDALGGSALIGSSLLAVAALVRRMRHAHGVERQQLEWISFAGALLGVALVLQVPTENAGSSLVADIGEGLVVLGLTGIPLAVGIAVLRYRLYEIDRIINRTLVYVALTLLLLGTYLVLVLVVGGFVRIISGDSSSVVTAISTLAVAALFQPLRRRIQATVDRRFYRRKYDAAQVVEHFGARLRDAVDLELLGADLCTAAAEAVQPAHVALWLRPLRRRPHTPMN